MAISDELSEEEQAIMVFLRRYFEAAGMRKAVWILNESENISDVRAILDSYREFYKGTEDTDKLITPAMARYLARSCPRSAVTSASSSVSRGAMRLCKL